MIEFVVVPYMAVSCTVGWAVFSPFAGLEDLDSFSLAKLTTIDLLTSFVPISLLLLVALSLIPDEFVTPITLLALFAVIFVFVACGMTVGLYLLSKMKPKTALQRMVLNGVVVPFGSVLSLAWFAIPVYACVHSFFYAIPAILLVVVLTWTMRLLACWACKTHVATVNQQ